MKINSELQNLQQWCYIKKYSINTTKTNIITILPKQTKTSISHLNLTINRSTLSIVCSANYSGVVIDNELNFKQHRWSRGNNV